MHFLLFYDFVPDYLARREQYRNEHLKLAWESHKRGELVLAGAAGDPVDCGILLFKGDSPAAAEAFARVDPYVTAGLVTKWQVLPWRTVVGDAAASPVHPT